jgi:hypothetical protein
MSYDEIKALAKELRRPITTLLALKDENDPFAVDIPRRLKRAEWFALLWEGLRFGERTHTRKVHYRLVSQPEPVIMPDGKPYENTLECSKYLDWASRDARYLSLVPYGHIIDRRNGESVLNPEEPEIEGGVFLDCDPDADNTVHLPEKPSLWLRRPVIRQNYHVEIVCEKSTMNHDVLFPLGELYGVHIVACAGDISTTRCFEIYQRIKADSRPCRILYVSDFDPGGQNMAVAAARKIEFLIRNEKDDHDIQVRQVALTFDQCEHYELPRTPLKETERRVTGWEHRYGEGATELDALEALHPGELRRILEREILRYYDPDLANAIEQAASDFDDQIEAVNDEVRAEYADRIAVLESDCAVLERRRKALFDEMDNALLDRRPDVDDVDWPIAADGDEDDDPVFDSTRGYVEQIDRYKRHQGKPTERRRWTKRSTATAVEGDCR